MRSTIIVLFLAAGLLAGCQVAAPGGIVTSGTVAPGWEKGPAVGLKAPQIRFIGADGKERPLRVAADWISVMGFVESKGKECCLLSPALTEAASRYWNKPVRVVQVSLPTAKCPHGPGCFESCHVRPLHLMALCDSDQTAHNAFGSPKDQALLVIDGYGKVVRATTVDKVGDVFAQVDELAKEAEKKQVPDYNGLYEED